MCAGVLFSPLNWQTELHTDLSSWLEVDDTKSVEIAVSITRGSVFPPPSERCAVTPAPVKKHRQERPHAEGPLKAQGRWRGVPH